MDKCRPYAKMGRTCKTRAIPEKKVIWPDINKDILQGKFKIRPLCRGDINKVVELWKMSYPELYGGSHEWMLIPEEYEEKVTMQETWKDDSVNKKYAMIVIEEIETGNIITATLFTKDDKNLHVDGTFGAMHPDYRTGKTGISLWTEAMAVYKWIEDSGAEYITFMCETWHPITQFFAFKQLGFKIAGIFPGQFTRWCGGQEEYRACEVHFYKFIGDGAKYTTKHEEWELIPAAKKLWDVLEEINKESDDEWLRKLKEKSKLAESRK